MTFNLQKAKPSELEALDQAITEFNIREASELPRAEISRMDFVAKTPEHALMGGIQAKKVNWGILHIELLFVYEPYRHRGIASALLQHVEKIAQENQCHVAHLSTFDFQARDFYLKHGYSVFGILENAPKGHCRYYMRKDLSQKFPAAAIRHMQKEDIHLLVANFCFPWSSAAETRKRWEKYYQEHLESIRTVAIVEKANRIVGYGSLLRCSEYPNFLNFPEICDIWIDENHQKVGLGRKLITFLEDLARIERYKKIGIGVGLYQDYGPAQKLYFKMGYLPDGHGITSKCRPVIPGETYAVDDDLILWLVKRL